MQLNTDLMNRIYHRITNKKNKPLNEQELKNILKKEIDNNKLENSVEALYKIVMELLNKEMTIMINSYLEKDINLSKEEIINLIKEECLKKNIIVEIDFLNNLLKNFD